MRRMPHAIGSGGDDAAMAPTVAEEVRGVFVA